MTAVGHPFDTIKVRLQCQSMEKPIYGEAPLLSCRMHQQSSRRSQCKTVQSCVNARRMAAAQGLVWCTIACQRRASACTCALLTHSSSRCHSLFKHKQSTCTFYQTRPPHAVSCVLYVCSWCGGLCKEDSAVGGLAWPVQGEQHCQVSKAQQLLQMC